MPAYHVSTPEIEPIPLQDLSDKFNFYLKDIQARQQSSKSRVSDYASYELSLLEGSRFVYLNGTLHHYHDSHPDDTTDRPTVVLIHGWDCWWMWWHKVIRYLNAQGIRTIAYDLKGHGWSKEDHQKNYSLESLSGDLRALCTYLKLTTYHIAAFSLGPFVALDFASRYPKEILSLTFFNFGYFPNSPMLSKVIPIMIPFMFDKVLRKIRWWPPIYLYARLTLARNPATKEDIMIGVNSLRFCDGEAIRQTAAQLAKIEVTESLPKHVAALDIPMLFVAGKGDQVVSWKNTEKLYRYAKTARLELIKKCGHLITLELPEKTAELIASSIFGAQPSRA